MKLITKKGITSKIIHIFISDSSSTTGAGLTGLVYNSAGLTAYYIRAGDASPTMIPLVDATVGTYTSGGFKEVDATNMPGIYELHPPDACFAAGADQVVIFLKGAANMVPLPLEIQLRDNTEKDVYDRIGTPAGTSIAADVADIPTVSEFNARTLLAADYFDPAADTVAHVTLVDTTTTNTDMRGTDNAALASVCTETRLAELDAANIPSDIDAIKAKTDNLPSGLAKNVAVPKFDVFMVLSSDHVTGATGKTVTGTISKDGGSFAALTNPITEVGNGVYTIASGLTQDERNADVSTLKFSADGCDDRIITIISS